MQHIFHRVSRLFSRSSSASARLTTPSAKLTMPAFVLFSIGLRVVMAVFFTQPRPAAAQSASPAGGAGGFMDPQILMLVLVFAVFYFIVFRPQQQKAKRHRAMLKDLKRGDKVLTAGGIIGTVVKLIDETEVMVEIAPNVQVTVVRATIAECLTAPAKSEDAKKDAANSNDAQSASAGGIGKALASLAFWRKKD